MEKYFDAFVYVANWGTHQLMFRLPRRLLDVRLARQYAAEEGLSLREKGQHVVLDFLSQEEDGGDWEEGEGWLPALLPLRTDLMAGDLRCLYLAWLSGIHSFEDDEDTPEPPLPPGLGKLTAPLKALVNFLRIDPDLIEAAAAADAGAAPTGPSVADEAAWVAALPEAEKNDLVLRVLQGKADYLGLDLQRRLPRGASGPT